MKQTLKYIYDKLLELTKIAEAKYSITLALASGVIVFGSSFIANTNPVAKVLASGTVIFALISVLYGFIALIARTIKPSQRNAKHHKQNLFHYKTILGFNETTYIAEIKKRYNFPRTYKPDEMDLDLARTVIAQARVTNLKFAYFNLSVVFLMLSVLLAVVLVAVVGGI